MAQLPPTNIKGTLLTTEHPMLKDLTEGFPPIADLPEGRVRIRLRADELCPVVHVKTQGGLRAFLINVDPEGNLRRGPELASNYSQVSGGPAPTVCQDAASAAAEAQKCADASRSKWVWYEAEDGTFRHKPADVLYHVQLNDVVLSGEIVVLARPSRKEVYHLVWPRLTAHGLN
jgi:hypothetical protein